MFYWTSFLTRFLQTALRFLAASVLALSAVSGVQAADKRLAYVVSDARIPFWDIMKRGIAHRAAALGYKLDV